ncbi:MAG: hypothetical protein K2X86_15800 [Cytophagaceae bacterium]|nr:hypothetical protein [Cytophagaceae bacterium]
MKSSSSFLKSVVVPVLNLFSFVFCLYLSIMFFLVLMADEAMNGKQNERLKEDFEAFVQKISDLPESLFAPVEKKEADLSRKLS